MKKIFLFLIPILFLVSCSDGCGCGVEDPTTPIEEMSYAGKILQGEHPLRKLPGTDEYLQLDEGYVKMFVKFGEQSVVFSAHNSNVIYEETFGSPHVKFEWFSSNNKSLSLNDIVNRQVENVIIYMPKEF